MDEDVLYALQGIFPDTQFKKQAPKSKDSSQKIAGAVLFGERMVPGEILSASRHIGNSKMPVLYVQGKGTLVGLEPLFQRHELRILPEHWTPSLLREIVCSEARSASPIQHDFLDGLVEGLRDPLASISGYLQLLRAQESDENCLTPALAATRQNANCYCIRVNTVTCPKLDTIRLPYFALNDRMTNKMTVHTTLSEPVRFER